eukprot:m51a1_g2910 hypothetical protein (203) ;mRNA; r:497592-501851
MAEHSYQVVYFVDGDDKKAVMLVGGRVDVAGVEKLFDASKIFVKTSDKAPSLLLNAAPDGLSYHTFQPDAEQVEIVPEDRPLDPSERGMVAATKRALARAYQSVVRHWKAVTLVAAIVTFFWQFGVPWVGKGRYYIPFPWVIKNFDLLFVIWLVWVTIVATYTAVRDQEWNYTDSAGEYDDIKSAIITFTSELAEELKAESS